MSKQTAWRLLCALALPLLLGMSACLPGSPSGPTATPGNASATPEGGENRDQLQQQVEADYSFAIGMSFFVQNKCRESQGPFITAARIDPNNKRYQDMVEAVKNCGAAVIPVGTGTAGGGGAVATPTSGTGVPPTSTPGAGSTTVPPTTGPGMPTPTAQSGGPQGDDGIVVIQNTSANAINLNGWTLTNDRTQTRYVFPAITIPPGGRLRVHSNSGANTAEDHYMGVGLPFWGTGSGRVTLRDPGGNVVGTYDY